MTERDLPNLEQLIKAVDAGADRLREHMDDFEGGVTEDGEYIVGVRAEYEEAVAQAANRIYEHYEDEGKRPPGEDIRTGRAIASVKREHPDLYSRYHALRGSIETGQRWISAKRHALSGLQTLNKTGAQLVGVA